MEIPSEDNLLKQLKTLPDHGTVKVEDGWYYIALTDEWNSNQKYFVDYIRSVYTYNSKLKSNHENLTRILQQNLNRTISSPMIFFVPPGTVGLHISCNPSDLGKAVRFKILDMCLWTNSSMGRESWWEKNKYVSTYITVNVELLGADAPSTPDGEPHITLCCCGIHLEPDNMDVETVSNCGLT